MNVIMPPRLRLPVAAERRRDFHGEWCWTVRDSEFHADDSDLLEAYRRLARMQRYSSKRIETAAQDNALRNAELAAIQSYVPGGMR